MNHIKNEVEIVSHKSTFWAPKGKKSLIILFGLLIFGFILVIFSFYITFSYAKAHLFMEDLRKLFSHIFNILYTTPNLQTPENISHLFNITIFNFYYTNLILLFNPSCVFSLIFNFIPNTGIIDLIIGYSLILFSSINLILVKFDLSKIFSNPLDPQIMHMTNSIAISMTILGFFFINMSILSVCALYWAMISFYLITMLISD